MLDRVDDFLYSHELRVRLPKELTNPELLAYVPSFLLKNLPEEVRVPLSEEAVEGSKYKYTHPQDDDTKPPQHSSDIDLPTLLYPLKSNFQGSLLENVRYFIIVNSRVCWKSKNIL